MDPTGDPGEAPTPTPTPTHDQHPHDLVPHDVQGRVGRQLHATRGAHFGPALWACRLPQKRSHLGLTEVRRRRHALSSSRVEAGGSDRPPAGSRRAVSGPTLETSKSSNEAQVVGPNRFVGPGLRPVDAKAPVPWRFSTMEPDEIEPSTSCLQRTFEVPHVAAGRKPGRFGSGECSHVVVVCHSHTFPRCSGRSKPMERRDKGGSQSASGPDATGVSTRGSRLRRSAVSALASGISAVERSHPPTGAPPSASSTTAASESDAPTRRP